MFNVEDLGIGEHERPVRRGSSADIYRLLNGHNLLRIVAGSGIRSTHFIPVLVENDDGTFNERIFPIKCTGDQSCVPCKLGQIETAIARDNFAEQHRGTFDFRSTFNPTNSWNWVVMSYQHLKDGSEPPEKNIPLILDTKYTVDQLINNKSKTLDVNDNVKYPDFYNYVWDIIRGEIPESERKGGKYARKYTYNMELYGDGPLPLTNEEKQTIAEFMEENNYDKIGDFYRSWCAPITAEDQLRSFGSAVFINLDSNRVVYKDQLRDAIVKVGLQAASNEDLKAIAGDTRERVPNGDVELEVVDDDIFSESGV